MHPLSAWTAQEKALLQERFNSMPVAELARLLGRSDRAVRTVAWKMGLRRSGSAGRRGTTCPIGTERVNKGMLERKVAETGNSKANWKRVDVIEWEALYGPVPPGHTLVLKDPRQPRTPENLIPLTDEERMRHLQEFIPPEVKALTALRGLIQAELRKIERAAEQSQPSESTC